jgi:hypothetical protein
VLCYIHTLSQAFKLDIDTPDMEMPIALMLRDEPELFNLVDEFFFELHFRWAVCPRILCCFALFTRY